jgi:hypothetical protein
MTAIPDNGYVFMLNSNKVVYLPTCLLFHMITKCFSEMSVVNMAGSVATMVSDVQGLIGRLTDSFTATARASEENRILHFPGDWKNDRVRMRNTLNNVVARIGYMGELVGQTERKKLYGMVERLSGAWTSLIRILDGKNTREMQEATRLPCVSYFRSENPDTWKQTMAQMLLSLDAEVSKQSPGRRLILLCHRRVRLALLKEIESIERKQYAQMLFSPDKILCVYNDDLPVTCPTCTKMTETTSKKSTRLAVRKNYTRNSQIRRKETTRVRSDTIAIGALEVPATLQEDA